MTVTQRRMSLAEFLALPEIDEKPYLEFHDGVVTQKVSPKLRHGLLERAVVLFFDRLPEARERAVAVPELRATFGGASLVPDVGVYRWDRLPRDETGQFLDDVYVPPDVAIEIASPGQGLGSLRKRCRWFVDNGVPIALLVLPKSRSVIVFRAGVEEQTPQGDDVVDFGGVIPGLQLVVRELFDALNAP